MPVVNFLACLDLEQNISFLEEHYLNLAYESLLPEQNSGIKKRPVDRAA
jgi:hypothetical protein